MWDFGGQCGENASSQREMWGVSRLLRATSYPHYTTTTLPTSVEVPVPSWVISGSVVVVRSGKWAPGGYEVANIYSSQVTTGWVPHSRHLRLLATLLNAVPSQH